VGGSAARRVMGQVGGRSGEGRGSGEMGGGGVCGSKLHWRTLVPSPHLSWTVDRSFPGVVAQMHLLHGLYRMLEMRSKVMDRLC
jgi:hypothetical protein